MSDLFDRHRCRPRRAPSPRLRGPLVEGLLACLLLLGTARADSGPRAIFDGATLNGWEGDRTHWRVEDAAITGEIPAGASLQQNQFLWWEGEVGDFDLALEYRLVGGPDANSGVQFRSARLPDGHAKGYQADIDDGTTWLGRIYDEHGRGLLVERGSRLAIAPDGRTWSDPFAAAESVAALVRPDAWNHYRIRSTAAHTTVWLNDRLVAVLDDRDARHAAFDGRIALQLHSGVGPVKVQFRDLRLESLGRTAPGPAVDGGADGGRAASSPVLWHTIGQSPDVVAPRDAAADAVTTVAGMMLTPGFRCDLVAAEPIVRQPIAMAIDPRGRLWVAEAHAYPNRRPEGEGEDRIVILADTDGDGHFESRTVFCQGLNLVSGLEVGFGGVFVGAAPHLLFIPDRDGDDVPDGEPEVLLDGWGFQDTHETLNSFTWGPDGWLYGTHGVFTTSDVGPPGAPPERRQRINAGVWRWHPVRREFEIFARGGSNQWGLDFTAEGDLFMTHCRSFFGGGGTSHVIRHGHFWNQTNAGHADFICREPPSFAPGLRNYLPAAARYDSGEGGAGKPGTDAVYGGHSHVGTMVYLGDNWPAIYRGRIFTHNLHGRQMNHQEVVRQGSGYEVFPAGQDMLHVPDESYVAVDLQYGPDGAVYMIDWCDVQHCHTNDDAKWDRSNGRVYRLAWSESWRPVRVDLAALGDAELVSLHTHANTWYVRVARRLLQERAASGRLDPRALDPLKPRVTDPEAVVALEALWTLHVTGRLDDSLLGMAFGHPHEQVRGQAIALATERVDAPRIAAERLVEAARHDSSPLVRRALASALPALPSSDRWRVGEALAMHAEDAEDRFLPKLTWSGLAALIEADPSRGLTLAQATPQHDLADSIRWYLGRMPAGRDLVSREIAGADAATAARSLRLLDFALADAGPLPAPADWAAAAGRFTEGEEATAAWRLSTIFGDADVRARMRAALADPQAAESDRRSALDLLARGDDPADVPLFVSLLDEPAMRQAAVPLAARSSDPVVAEKLLKVLDQLDGGGRSAALSALTSKGVFATALLDAIDAGRVPRDDLTAVQVRQLRGLGDEAVGARVDALWGRLNESSEAARATMARLKKVWAEAPAWAIDHDGHGRAVFTRVCANCHVHGAEGGRLGPNLTGSWTNGPDYFIDNLVDPNAVVGPDYQLTVLVTDDGRSLNGIVAEETPALVVLRTPDGEVRVPKSSIQERATSPVSMMPSGLLENLPEADFLALVKFLTTPR
jgi:putative membrane-bound dehydrogenase-like protein